MIGYQKIIGGIPSSVGAMSKHLLNNTLTQDLLDIAGYYSRGGAPEPTIVGLAREVVAGELEFSEALGILMEEQAQRIPRPTPEEQDAFTVWDEKARKWIYTRDLDEEREERLLDIEGRLSYRLDVLIERFEQGLDVSHLAVIRPDIHPSVLLGLGIEPDGMLSGDEVNALIAGRKADGSFIKGKTYAAERRLPENPNDRVRRWSQPIGSYDFCPTPDKSVSVAWAFATKAEQAGIYAAHIEAAREAVAHIASGVGVARLGKGGQEGEEQGHVAWLEFTHHTARHVVTKPGADGTVEIVEDGPSGDPHLHTHFLIPNAVFCESGHVGSLDTAAIRGLISEAGFLYHALLGQKLRDAGFEVVADERTGAARMTAIPEAIRTLFSKRSATGEDLAKQFTAARGEVWEELTDEQRQARTKAAARNPSQRSKGLKDPVADVASWRDQARQVGWIAPVSLKLYGPPVEQKRGPAMHQAAYEMALPWLAKRLEHAAVVPHWDLRVAALRGLVAHGITGIKDVSAVTRLMWDKGVIQYGSRTGLIYGQEEDRRRISITTALHEGEELEFVRLAKEAAADTSNRLPVSLLGQKIVSSGLDFRDSHGRAQKRAIERVGTGGAMSLIVAAAGAGKTTALKPLVAAWRAQGREVYGASLAWRQADDLIDAGIERRKLLAFSVLIDRIGEDLGGEEPPPITPSRNTVIAVDEWGLLGTRQGLELLRLREKYGFTIVALGDDKQCSSIEAGAIIDLTRRALGVDAVPTILTTKRQQDDREKRIVGLLRDGKAAEALDMKRADGTAEMVPGGPDGVIARVAKLYAERLAATGEAPTISAPTNSDAHRISEAIRLERRQSGSVGPDLMTIPATDGTRSYDMKLAAGDHVRLFKNTGADYGNGKGGAIGRNGSVLTVVDVNAAGITLKAKTGRVGTVAWERLDAGGRALLAYGDAMTIHTAQGSTQNEHIFALPAGSQAISGDLGYSAGTRHRLTSYLLTSELAERTAIRESRPINDAHEITLDDKWANVAAALNYRPERDSALALIDRALTIKRSALAGFRSAMGGVPSSAAADLAQRRRLDVTLAIEARAVTQAIRKGLGRVHDGLSRRVSGRSLGH